MYATFSVADWKKRDGAFKYQPEHQLKFNITRIQSSSTVCFRCSALSPRPDQKPCCNIIFFLSYMQVSDLSDKSMNCHFSVH